MGKGVNPWRKSTVFVCNPKKWAIDRFLDRRAEHYSWGVRKSDRESERFAPGQLGVIRVGVDRRSSAERYGRPPVEPGIYALCEVESSAFEGTGASDEFWAEGEAREPGWPTIKLRYLRTFLEDPLSITKLRAAAAEISSLLLDGFQASSFPIPKADFERILGLLGVDLDQAVARTQTRDLALEKLAAMEQRYLHACPGAKERLSQTVERGQIGALVKRATGFKCQVCDALGLDPVGFRKRNGEPYVEAHHVMPVAKREVGSLAAGNVMTLCANHHRQMHYGDIQVEILPHAFRCEIDGIAIEVPRFALDPEEAAQSERTGFPARKERVCPCGRAAR